MNGGGFVTGASGTDFSTQDAAQYAVTDGVANGTTTLTSATANFGTDVVGNLVYVAGGTGSITGRWKEIVSRTNATTIEVDSSTGLTAGTGVTLNIGGAWASPGPAAAATSPVVAGNRIWVKTTGGYTTAATIVLAASGTDAARISVEGYTTTRGDGEQAVITSTNSAATSILSVTGDYWIFRNLTLDGASLSLRALYITSAASNPLIDNCWVKGATQNGLYIDGLSNGAVVSRCLGTGNGTSGAHAAFATESDHALFDGCVARDNGGNGFATINSWLEAVNCLAHDNSLSGFYVDGVNTGMRLLYCTAQGNTLDGLRLADVTSLAGGLVRHCLFAGNAGYGVRSITTDYSTDARLALCFEANAFYSNTLGARFQVPTGSTDVTLTADPFADSVAADEDLSLNFLLGGGLAARGLALGLGLRSSPETSAGLVDAGAVQSGGGAGATTGLGVMRALWRELTGEKYGGVAPDSVVDRYLMRGLEWLNQITEYHVETLTDAVTLVSATQEYALPDKVVRVEWVEWNGQELTRGDIREWRNRKEPWRSEPASAPQQWAVYSNRIVFRPKPSAAAVAADSAPVIRAVTAPPEIATYGPEMLEAQDWRLAVYYGAFLWSVAYPDSALARTRAEGLVTRAETEAGFTEAENAAKETVR